jgi:hypothetical protein
VDQVAADQAVPAVALTPVRLETHHQLLHHKETMAEMVMEMLTMLMPEVAEAQVQ